MLLFWQGQKDSNPRHSVLETDALPAELYPYKVAPQVGLEPTTLRLTAACSTNWAIEEYIQGNTYINIYRLVFLCRQRSTFPGSHPPSIIDAKELNFCVRHGNRCTLFAFITDSFMYNLPSYTQNWTISFVSSGTLFPIFFTSILSWSSPRLISTALLNMLPHLHTLPIYHVVFVESYYLSVWEILS